MSNIISDPKNMFLIIRNHFRVIENDFKEKNFFHKDFLQEIFFAAWGVFVSRFDEDDPPPWGA